MTKQREIAKWLHRLKGVGFIETESGCADVYTHYATPQNFGFDGLYRGEVGREFGRNNKHRQMIEVPVTDRKSLCKPKTQI